VAADRRALGSRDLKPTGERRGGGGAHPQGAGLVEVLECVDIAAQPGHVRAQRGGDVDGPGAPVCLVAARAERRRQGGAGRRGEQDGAGAGRVGEDGARVAGRGEQRPAQFRGPQRRQVGRQRGQGASRPPLARDGGAVRQGGIEARAGRVRQHDQPVPRRRGQLRRRGQRRLHRRVTGDHRDACHQLLRGGEHGRDRVDGHGEREPAAVRVVQP